MNILILGGTQFVGRHIVEAFLEAGHQVSTLTRGKSKDPLPAQVERLHGDRNEGAEGLRALGDRSWDACVDVSGYTPQQVRASAEGLRDRVGRYVFISTVSVYQEPGRHPIRESDSLLSPAAEDVTEVNGETYGPLKVTCETIVQEVYGNSCTLLRPQIVAGPFDPTGRYSYWLTRVAKGGEMLAPGYGSDHVQVIDARDLARFTVRVIEEDHPGIFNLAGPRLTWAQFMGVLGAANPSWVSSERLAEAGITPAQLPLFIPDQGSQGGFMDVSNERAQAAGLELTDPAVTAKDTQAWIAEAEAASVLLPERAAAVLSPDREAELVEAARQD
ncbi:MAG: NAD-dependent epimerase/dehydratase family protein [Deinococcota bacterium]|nr:NAD-dependent epimerase/dehydratase family protein [Deinococcota bacterium]